MEEGNEKRSENQGIGDGKEVTSKKELSKHGDSRGSPDSVLSNENITQEDTIEKAVRYLEKLKIGYDVKHADDIKDSCTQTSKTILQLARLEKGDISPDSLSPTPRSKQKTKQEIETIYPKKTDYAKSSDNLRYHRKREVVNYINNYEREVEESDSATFPRCSLIETYLSSKTNTRKSHDSEQYENRSISSDEFSKSGHSRFLEQTSPFKNLVKKSGFDHKNGFKSQSFIEPPYADSERREPQQISRFTVKRIRQQSVDLKNMKYHPRHLVEDKKMKDDASGISAFSRIKYSPKFLAQKGRSNSFMSPTIASEQKSKLHEVRTIKRLISPTKRGRSVSPKSNGLMQHSKFQKIPYIDESFSDGQETSYHKKEDQKKYRASNTCIADGTNSGYKDNFVKLDLEDKYSQDSIYDCSQINDTNSSSSTDNLLFTILNRIRNDDWNIALRGLAEITELCRNTDREILYPHMVSVNQRLLELLRSPRSHVCRTACQAAGHLFESMKDTRRPEFDDIVDILLSKTADANKFIRQDANLALDCMVTHIPIYHSIRALCVKGPSHKNHLVRTATVRLMICAVVIAGPSVVLSPNSSDITRKRIICHMAKFIDDKNMETRKYGERLYKILCKEPYFDVFLKKYLEKEELTQFKISLKSLYRKH